MVIVCKMGMIDIIAIVSGQSPIFDEGFEDRSLKRCRTMMITKQCNS